MAAELAAIGVESTLSGVVIHEGAGPVKSRLAGVFVRFLVVPALMGGRVCGVAVKAERPEAKPRTNGLEAGTVRAMLVEPGRRDVGSFG